MSIMKLLSHTALSLPQLSSAHTALCKRRGLILTRDQERQRAKDLAARTSRSICSSPLSFTFASCQTYVPSCCKVIVLSSSLPTMFAALFKKWKLAWRFMKQQSNLNVTTVLTEEEAETGVQRLMGMQVGQCECGLFY